MIIRTNSTFIGKETIKSNIAKIPIKTQTAIAKTKEALIVVFMFPRRTKYIIAIDASNNTSSKIVMLLIQFRVEFLSEDYTQL